MHRVVLPWPRQACSQNARVCRKARARAVKNDRRDAFFACHAAGVRKLGTERVSVRVSVRVTLSKPNPQIDDQNAIGWCKAQMDGVADAIGVDDNRWNVTWAFGAPGKPGAVLVEISQP